MPIIVGDEEYLSVAEACDYLSISYPTLRNRTRTAGIRAYKQGISRSVYYRKSDLDSLKEFRPIEPDEDKGGGE